MDSPACTQMWHDGPHNVQHHPHTFQSRVAIALIHLHELLEYTMSCELIDSHVWHVDGISPGIAVHVEPDHIIGLHVTSHLSYGSIQYLGNIIIVGASCCFPQVTKLNVVGLGVCLELGRPPIYTRL